LLQPANLKKRSTSNNFFVAQNISKRAWTDKYDSFPMNRISENYKMFKFWSKGDDDSSSFNPSVHDKNDEQSDDWEEFADEQQSVVEEDANNPNAAWEKIVKDQIFLDPPQSTNVKPRGCIRIVCMSDTHGKHRDVHLPPGDILLHGGDFSRSGEINQYSDLSAYFRDSGFEQVICIAGNHDMTLHPSYYNDNWGRFHHEPFDCVKAQAALEHCIYLKDSSHTTKHGIEVYGSPWSPEFFNWAFNLPRGSPIRAVWDRIPDSTDLLITHGPPLGRGDMTRENGRAGCNDLTVVVQDRVKPRIHLFGHIHEDAGVSFDNHTLYINGSNLNILYQAVNHPIVVDLPLDKSKPAMVVPPSCAIASDGLLDWIMRQKQYHLLAHLMKGCDPVDLPSGNDLFTETAYEDLCNKLMIRDRDAAHELRMALSQLYSESFPK
jgi:hypothetical protein